MSDINKFTSKEVLNKVLLDSSGNAVNAFSHTTQEALNAALDATNNRLNVSLAGGTISGDVTITGDLTVNGSNTNTYDELLEGQLIVRSASAGSVTAHADADDLVVENSAGGGMSILTPDGSYGALFFGSPSDSIGAQVSYRQSSTEMLIGTRLSGGILKLRTADGTDALTLDASQNATFAGNINLADDKALTLGSDSDAQIWNDGSNTYIRNNTSDQDIIFQVNDGGSTQTEVMRIDASSAELYIGTSSQGVSINGNTSATGTITGINRALSAYKSLAYNALDHTYKISGTTKLTLDSSGNATFAGEVQSTSNITSNSGGVGKVSLATSGNHAVIDMNNSTPSHVVRIHAGGDTFFNGGNVGIGLSSSIDKKLHIASSTSTDGITIENTSTGATQIRFEADSSALRGLIGVDDSNGNAFLASTNGKAYVMCLRSEGEMHFGTGGNNTRFILDDNSRISLTNNDSGGTGGSDGLSANTIFGYLAGEDIASGGVDNTYFGHKAGSNNATGDDNVFIGSNAGKGAHGNSNSNNVGIGSDSMLALTTGNSNTVMGQASMKTNTSGSRNVGLGQEALFTNATTHDNTSIGYQAGYTTTGADNVYVGAQAGKGAAGAEANNVGVGSNSLKVVTTGGSNVAIGKDAMVSATASHENIAIGFEALGDIAVGEGANVAIGYYAMRNVDEGTGGGDADYNIAIGYDALKGGDFASNDRQLRGNVAIGAFALDATADNAQTGTIAIGESALTALTSGAGNTAVGYISGQYNETGSQNTYVGYASGLGASGNSHSTNTAVGYFTLKDVTTGGANTVIGAFAGDVVTTQDSLTLVGKNAGSAINHNDANGTVAVGASALGALTSGQYNVAIGYNSMDEHLTGRANTCLGWGTMSQSGGDTTAQDNTFIGASSGSGDWAGAGVDQNTAVGYATMTGAMNGANNNTALGAHGLEALTTGDGNVAVGAMALDSVTIGGDNVAIGYNALVAEDVGDRAVAIGSHSLYQQNSNTNNEDSLNTAVGHASGYSVVEGQNNVLIGAFSGHTGTALTSGGNNTMVGTSADAGSASASNRTAIGYTAQAQADNSVTLGNADVHSVYMNQDGSANVIAGQMQISDTAINKTTSYTGLSNVHTKISGTTDASDTFIGLETAFTFNDSDTLFNEIMGIYSETHSQASAGEANTIYGMYNRAKMSGNTDVANIYGGRTIAQIIGGTVDSDVYGMKVEADVNAGTLSGDIYGLYIKNDSEVNPSGSSFGLYIRSDTNQDNSIQAQDDSSVRFRVSDDGVVTSEGAMNASTGMDYAEYFESKDGKEIAIGSTVKLNGTKIVACSDGDTPIGVIRPVNTSSVVAGGQEFHWESMFMKDDYGANVWESYTLTKWTEEITLEEYSKRGKDETGGVLGGSVNDSKVEGSEAIEAKDAVLDEDGKEIEPAVDAVDAVSDKYYREHRYHSDRLPSGVTAPKDAETISPANKRQKLNPDYDGSKSYKSREERTEWHIVGLLGQIPITKGQPVASNWTKMNDVSDTVEMYFVK
jgi:hypothetical protein